MKFWLFKSEPENYSIDALKKDKRSAWSGVRNYQARNFMTQQMEVGDLGIFYHSSSDPSGAVGVVKVCAKAHADVTALDKKGEYADPKSTKEKPIWECVDVEFVEKFSEILSLAAIKAESKLAKMELLRKGSRLSIQPIQADEFATLLTMASAKTKI